MKRLTLTVAIAVLSAVLSAQSTPTFEIVSIKRNVDPASGGGGRTNPDGSQYMTNFAIRQFILAASPVQANEVVGLPAWAEFGGERYDVVVKPRAGSTREDIRLMWQAMFAERMKLKAHVEEREETVFALVLARSDGQLGPQLKPSSLDCMKRPDGPPPPPPPPSVSRDERIAIVMTRCGAMMGPGIIASGGTTLAAIAPSLKGLVGGEVRDQTGLKGFYTFTLTFTPQRGGTAPDTAFNDAPEIFTALQEQLGLKLRSEKAKVPIFVIDHIERPTEN